MSCCKPSCGRTELRPINVSFRVLDNDGCPVVGAVFRLQTDEENGQFTHAMSNRNGTVTFCNVCPGTYYLIQIATAYGHEFEEEVEPFVVTILRNGVIKIDGIALYCFNVFNPREEGLSRTPEAPTINPVNEGDVTITGTGEPCCKVEVFFPRCRFCVTCVNRDGTWIIDVPQHIALEEGNVITAELVCDCRPRSTPGEAIVGNGNESDNDNDNDNDNEIEDIVLLTSLSEFECY